MLRKMKDLKGFSIGARDGDIGEANDFIFDDKNWTVRYLVADTNRWLPGRKVLISPIVVDQADWEGKRLPVLLTQEQVKNSPDISMDEELSAQDEVKYYNYYGFPYYWTGDEIWGPVTLPRDLIAEGIDRQIALTEEVNHSHLRSMKDVIGYPIQATDGEIGHVDDFIVDDDAWTIRYMVIDTAQLAARKENPGGAAMDCHCRLEKFQCLRQSFARGDQERTGIQFRETRPRIRNSTL